MIAALGIRPLDAKSGVKRSGRPRARLSEAARACAVETAGLLAALKSAEPADPRVRVAKRPSGQPYLAAPRRKSAALLPSISYSHLRSAVAGFAAHG